MVVIGFREAIDRVGVRSAGGDVEDVYIAAAAHRIAAAGQNVVACAAGECVLAIFDPLKRVVTIAAMHIRAGVEATRLQQVVAAHAPQLAAAAETAE